MLVFNRGDVLVQGRYGCCSEEVVGRLCCQTLEVVAVDGAGILGCAELVDVLASYCWSLGK